jgi:hypothetical protein
MRPDTPEINQTEQGRFFTGRVQRAPTRYDV